jgi:AcrR family transcriptional regulator
MSTRESIIRLADQLIRDKGYNAFSFYDIAKHLGIKNASIHYYFPGKTQLGLAVIKEHRHRFDVLKQETATKPPAEKLKAFIDTYTSTRREERICIVGSLASDLHSLEPALENELKLFGQEVLEWLEEVLQQGLACGAFSLNMPTRSKALMIITNLLAALQLTRLTGVHDFYTITETIMQEITPVQQKEHHS